VHFSLYEKAHGRLRTAVRFVAERDLQSSQTSRPPENAVKPVQRALWDNCMHDRALCLSCRLLAINACAICPAVHPAVLPCHLDCIGSGKSDERPSAMPEVFCFSSDACHPPSAALAAAPATFREAVHTTGVRKARDFPSSIPFSTTSTQLDQTDTRWPPNDPILQGQARTPRL
jgi:hypothetical protein